MQSGPGGLKLQLRTSGASFDRSHEPTAMNSRIDELRAIVAEVLEVDPKDLIDTADFEEDYGANSLGLVEILNRVEMTYRIEITQSELPDPMTLRALYAVVARCAGWPD